MENKKCQYCSKENTEEKLEIHEVHCLLRKTKEEMGAKRYTTVSTRIWIPFMRIHGISAPSSIDYKIDKGRRNKKLPFCRTATYVPEILKTSATLISKRFSAKRHLFAHTCSQLISENTSNISVMDGIYRLGGNTAFMQFLEEQFNILTYQCPKCLTYIKNNYKKRVKNELV